VQCEHRTDDNVVARLDVADRKAKFQQRSPPLRYGPLDWGAVFPLGMYAVATKQMAAALGLAFLAPLAPAFFEVALAAWTLAFIGLAWELPRKLAHPDLWYLALFRT